MNKKLLGFLAIGSLMCMGATYNSSYKGNKVLVLTDKNTVSLALPITGKTAAEVQRDLMALDRALGPSKDPIYLVLNSPGGSIEDGLKIASTAQGLTHKVHTVQLFSASMSFILAQLLENRYVLSNSTVMSHPATVQGVDGTIPGTFMTRALALVSSLNQINSIIALRAKMDPIAYNTLIEKELWMQGQEAVARGFADEVVSVRCDVSLAGLAEPRKIDLGIFGEVSVVFNKCPLITEPVEAKAGNIRVSVKDLRSQIDAAGGSRLESR